MNKKINIFLAGVLCSLGVMAQEDTLIVRQNDEVVEMDVLLPWMQER